MNGGIDFALGYVGLLLLPLAVGLVRILQVPHFWNPV
jgi:hypothetical protein